MLGVVRDLRSPRSLGTPDEAAAYQEHLLAEYVLARLAHGVADGTIRGEIAAVEQFLEHAGVPVWEVEPAHADRFLGQHQRHQAPGTRRGKAGAVDLFFRFLEARYRGEIHQLTGRVVASPIDDCNRPRHSGDFQVRVPPSPAALAAFFAAWRGELPAARKWLAAARHYAMARLAAEVGLRLRELCMLRLEDLHFGHGPLGKIHVRMGKGSRGSGPRERLVPMLGDARPLLVWWVSEVRGQFSDDWELPRSVLFPSERGGPIGGDTFAAALGQAAARHLRGPVTRLTPHVLRHACASRLYGEGIGLAAIQQLLGHRWLSTTVHQSTSPTRRLSTPTSRRPGGPPRGSGSRGMQWNLRLAAAQRGIWRSSDLRRLLAGAGLEISAGKMSHLWSGRPISIRLDDLDVICGVLGCEPGELLVRDPDAGRATDREKQPVPAPNASSIRPARRGGRSLPPV